MGESCFSVFPSFFLFCFSLEAYRNQVRLSDLQLYSIQVPDDWDEESTLIIQVRANYALLDQGMVLRQWEWGAESNQCLCAFPLSACCSLSFSPSSSLISSWLWSKIDDQDEEKENSCSSNVAFLLFFFAVIFFVCLFLCGVRLLILFSSCCFCSRSLLSCFCCCICIFVILSVDSLLEPNGMWGTL